MNNEQFLNIRKAVLEAGNAIMQIYNADDQNIQTKADQSPVTAADLAADGIIYQALRNIFPEEAIITEEQSASHELQPTNFFIVDPLDGTKEFIHRRGDFTVNIGYIRDGFPEFGIVYAPAKSRLFYTIDGQAYEEAAPYDMNQIGERKPIKTRIADNDALAIVASKSHRDAATDAYISKYKTADFRSAGSSLKFCLVATGEADFYPRLGPTMEWDTAAADAIIRAAGGEVLDFETKTPLVYGKQDYRNGFFLVKSRGVNLIE